MLTLTLLFALALLVLWFAVAATKLSRAIPPTLDTYRSHYCYGKQETRRRAQQIACGYLTHANGLERR